VSDTRAKIQDKTDTAKSWGRRLQDKLPDSISKLIDEAREAEVMLFAGGLAFYALISIAPFVVISFWITGELVGEERIEELGENIDEMAPGGADVSGAFDSLAQVGAGVGFMAILAALWPATAYGSGLVRAFDRLSHKPERSAQGVRGRLKALMFVVLLPGFLLAALGASYVASGLLDNGILLVVSWVLALIAGTVGGAIVLSIIYLVFGPEKMSFRSTAIGALAASAAIAVMSLGYLIYLGQGADFEERVAGSGFAAVVLLALWLYLANIILLIGYSYCRSCEGITDDDPERDRERDEQDCGDEDRQSVDLREHQPAQG
jgi:membrane protein